MAKWEDFSVSKEYKLWGVLREMCQTLDISENTLISTHDLTDYWEPLFEKIFRLGVQYKYNGKLKEIKIDWIRPMFFSGIEDKLIIDGKCWTTELNREAINKAQELNRNFRDLVNAINDYEKIDSTTFKKMKKVFQDSSKVFFKNLILFVTKKLYDQIKYIFKSILRPLLDLRKANYHLFLLEKKNEGDSEITLFKDKHDLKMFTETISHWFVNEEIKMKRDCDNDTFEEYLNKNNNKTYYQYSYLPKNRDGFKSNENTKVRKGILQKKFEDGITTFLNYLYVKLPDQFYQEIDIHKLFKNFEVPKALELKPLSSHFFILQKLIKEFKEKLWEMKLNGYCRIKMPITKNTEIISLTKNIFENHIKLEKLIGNKLKYDQYLFIYDCLAFIIESNRKDSIVVFQDKNFMEDVLPKYVIYNGLRNSVKILLKMKEKIKEKHEIFNLKIFFQPLKYELDSQNNYLINAWYYTDSMKKQTNTEIEETKILLHKEIEEFKSRFWILEGLFNPADRDLWMDAINLLKEINIVVQDDIRDYILTNYDPYNIPTANKKNLLKTDSDKNNINISIKKNQSIKNMRKESNNRAMSNSKAKKPVNRRNNQQLDKTEKSIESDDESVIGKNLKIHNPNNLELLRPPTVWNFPVEKVLNKVKDSEKKK